MSLLDLDHRTARLVVAGGLLALAGGVIGAGCGGGDYSRIGDYCQAQATADCSAAIVQACWGASDATLEADTQACIAARSAISKCNPLSLPYHAEFADACISAHEAAFAGSQVDAPTLQMMNDACLQVFNKGGAAGAKCMGDGDCDVGSGYHCVVRAGGSGTCQVPVPTDPGQSCTAPDAQCTDGFFCDNNCIADPGPGGKCAPGVPCGAGYRCDSKTSVCAAQLADGAACLQASDCVGGFCIGSQCSSTFTFALGGSACNNFKAGK